MTDKPVQPPALQSTEEVGRIREIIFGSQIRDYQQRFDAAARDLDRLQQALDRLAEQLADQDRDHRKKLQDLRAEMRQADDALREELRQATRALGDEKVDRRVLGELFVQVGNQLQAGGSLAELLAGLIQAEQA